MYERFIQASAKFVYHLALVIALVGASAYYAFLIFVGVVLLPISLVIGLSVRLVMYVASLAFMDKNGDDK